MFVSIAISLVIGLEAAPTRLPVHPRVVVKVAAVVVGVRRLAMVKMTLVAFQLMIASILTKTSVQERIK
eukprot:symbB.v1.2.035328.t1/scaffold4729.1/size35696/1